jgi:branched-chain amino acid transport system permease protein
LRRLLPNLVALCVGAAVILVLPLFLGDTNEYRFAFVAAFFVACLGLQILTGYSGLISLGHSGFMLIGAYTTTILSVRYGWDDLVTIPLGGLVAGAVGFLFGFPALRLRGVYLALATFAIPIALVALAKKYSGFTYGPGGTALKRVLSGHEAYITNWIVAGVMLILAFLVLAGRLGRAFRTIRESDIAAVSSGVNLWMTKTLAFGISAFFAGVGGSLYAITIGFVNPDTFQIELSLLLLIGVVVGGLGSLLGVVFGALFIEYVRLYAPDILRWVETPFGAPLDPQRAGAGAAVYGMLLLLILYLAPAGVAGLLRSAYRLLANRAYTPSVASSPRPVKK